MGFIEDWKNGKFRAYEKPTDGRPTSWEEYRKTRWTSTPYGCEGNVNGEPLITDTLSQEKEFGEFETKAEWEALIAFIKLLQLRKAWIGEWKPNWSINNNKYVITNLWGDATRLDVMVNGCPLSFPTEQMQNEFMICFKDLLDKAIDLI